MKAEIITIGDELCRGEIVNTNASWLAAALWDLQVSVAHLVTCRDVAEDMATAIRGAAARSEIVLLTGGLGPTMDDLTVDLVCQLVGCEAVIHEPSAERMRERFVRAGVPLVANSSRQVRYPAAGVAYENREGLAPGFEVEIGGARVFALPGPPRELQAIFNDHLGARLQELRRAQGEHMEHVARRIFRVFGRGESQIASALEGLSLPEGSSLHFQVKFPETLVKVVVRSSVAERAEAGLAELEAEIRARLGNLIYDVDDGSLAGAVQRQLAVRDQSLAVAESCTGGMICSLLTDVPGISESFRGGAVTYSNAEKVRQLGVAQATLDEHGAVSEAVVAEMAAGIRERTGADWGVAVSGVAGPGGGSEDKPVGTVWIAVDGPGQARFRKKYLWPGRRDQVRSLAAHWALNALRKQLLEQGS